MNPVQSIAQFFAGNSCLLLPEIGIGLTLIVGIIGIILFLFSFVAISFIIVSLLVKFNLIC